MIIKLKTKQVYIKYEAKIKKSASILTSSHYQVQWQVRTELANYCMLHGSSSQNDVMYDVLMESNFLWMANSLNPSTFLQYTYLYIWCMCASGFACQLPHHQSCALYLGALYLWMFQFWALHYVPYIQKWLVVWKLQEACWQNVKRQTPLLTQPTHLVPSSVPAGCVKTYHHQLVTCRMCHNLPSPACYLLDAS